MPSHGQAKKPAVQALADKQPTELTVMAPIALFLLSLLRRKCAQILSKTSLILPLFINHFDAGFVISDDRFASSFTFIYNGGKPCLTQHIPQALTWWSTFFFTTRQRVTMAISQSADNATLLQPNT